MTVHRNDKALLANELADLMLPYEGGAMLLLTERQRVASFVLSSDWHRKHDARLAAAVVGGLAVDVPWFNGRGEELIKRKDVIKWLQGRARQEVRDADV